MRQDFVEFTPSHLPFLGREDRNLENRLGAELPAVLAWALAGWEDYRQRSRLDPLAAVGGVTSTYRMSNDSTTGFIDDRCLLNPHMTVTSSSHAARGVALSRSNGR